MIVSSTPLPALSAAFTRSDTYPDPPGLPTVTAIEPFTDRTGTRCQVVPSSKETSTVGVRSLPTFAPGWDSTRTGMVSGLPAAAVFMSSSCGANPTVHSGSGVAEATVPEVNVHAALTWVDSTNGAGRWADAASRYRAVAAGTANTPRAGSVEAPTWVPSAVSVVSAVEIWLTPQSPAPLPNIGSRTERVSPVRHAPEEGGSNVATVGPNTPRLRVAWYRWPARYRMLGLVT